MSSGSNENSLPDNMKNHPFHPGNVPIKYSKLNFNHDDSFGMKSRSEKSATSDNKILPLTISSEKGDQRKVDLLHVISTP